MVEIFDVTTPKADSPLWVINYCLNKFSEKKNITSAINSVLVQGGIDGGGSWGIQRWNKTMLLDLGIGRFDGYRFYVGPEERGLSEDEKPVDAYLSEHDLKRLLVDLINKSENIANKREVQYLIRKDKTAFQPIVIVDEEKDSEPELTPECEASPVEGSEHIEENEEIQETQAELETELSLEQSEDETLVASDYEDYNEYQDYDDLDELPLLEGQSYSSDSLELGGQQY